MHANLLSDRYKARLDIFKGLVVCNLMSIINSYVVYAKDAIVALESELNRHKILVFKKALNLFSGSYIHSNIMTIVNIFLCKAYTDYLTWLK